jgi:hypothetical protein
MYPNLLSEIIACTKLPTPCHRHIDQPQSGFAVSHHDHCFILGKIRQRREYISFRISVQSFGGFIQN